MLKRFKLIKDITYYHFYSYQKTIYSPNQYDLSSCDTLIPKTGLYFNIPGNYLFAQNKFFFENF
jgi:hypothetical protein